jgi:ABC transport system ATP-binding/permease protein
MASLIGRLRIIQSGRQNRDLILTHEPLTIGHKEKNWLVLKDPEVFPFHVEIVWKGDRYAISPLRPKTPIWINGKQVLLQTELPLAHADVIRIGEAELHFFEQTDAALSSESDSDLLKTVVDRATCKHELQVTTPEGTQNFPLRKSSLILGRNPQCDIAIDAPVVSKQHAQLTWDKNTYVIEDLGSTNGLTFAGNQIKRKRLEDGDRISIWDDVTLTYRALPNIKDLEPVQTLNLRDRKSLMLGRDSRNDMVIDHPVVSRFHAKIELEKGDWIVTDLNSSIGTFVNSQKVVQQQSLRPGDTIRIGPLQLIFNLNETLTAKNEAGNLRLDAVNLCKMVGQGKLLLDDISLSILPREFVVVAGVSGGGKSTLLDALNGFRPATSGNVLINGMDLYSNFDSYRTELGYVPQKDIIHMELSVEEALDFAAQLRMPSDTTLPERKQRIQEVLNELGLSQRRDVPIRSLSGGQLKRVSMGVELLTKPSLFFLDEATSGLDPGTEGDIMRLLRSLADSGRTILLITHATENVKLCDLVVFLAAGGRVAYFGPPSEAPAYFGVQTFNEIYPQVERERSPEAWQQQYLKSAQYRQYVVGRKQTIPQTDSAINLGRSTKRKPSNHFKRTSPWRQFQILSARHLAVLKRDRLSFLFTLGIAPIVGLLDLVSWQRNLFDYQDGSAAQSIVMLFTTALIAVMVGSLTTMREIVKEQDIYRRERMIGLQLLPYLFSKVWIGLLLALYQAAFFLLFKCLAVDFHVTSDMLIGLYLTLFLTTLAGMVMGLLVSAFSPNQTLTPLAIILVLIPQVTFGGGLIPVSNLSPVGQWINNITLTKWSFESLVTVTNLGKDVAEDRCWQLPEAERKTLSDSDKNQCACLRKNVFQNQSCAFPGIHAKYVESVDQAEPTEPSKPEVPANPAGISEFKNQMDTYKTDMQKWKEQYRIWMTSREKAIGEAEGIIDQINKDYGKIFQVNVPSHWSVLGLLMTGMFALIFWAQKRKDTAV